MLRTFRMFPTPGRLGESRHAVQRAMLLAGRVKEERHGGHGGQLLDGQGGARDNEERTGFVMMRPEIEQVSHGYMRRRKNRSSCWRHARTRCRGGRQDEAAQTERQAQQSGWWAAQPPILLYSSLAESTGKIHVHACMSLLGRRAGEWAVLAARRADSFDREKSPSWR